MPTKIAVPTGSTPTLVSAARSRQFICIQNHGTADVYIAWDLTCASVTIDTGSFPGYKILPNGALVLSAEQGQTLPAYSAAFYAVHGDASTHNLSVQEY